jgi:hypothetical protein
LSQATSRLPAQLRTVVSLRADESGRDLRPSRFTAAGNAACHATSDEMILAVA